ncbi:MAG: hypothetical protein GXP38_09295 [Chloroflexi bacterium]|nr:hypothetical protein [Chloroflexota bacterium]
MNNKEFGKLVAALRRQLAIRIGENVFQKDLERMIGLTSTDKAYQRSRAGIIGRIERGELANLSERDILKLADAFELNRMERKEFITAANRVSLKFIYETGRTVDDELAVSLDSLRKCMLPAFILDPFSDIIAVNWITIQLLGITADMFEFAIDEPLSTNLLYYVLSPISGFCKLIGVDDGYQDSYAQKTIIMNMQIFRRTSLRYRHHPYYRYLINGLRFNADSVLRRRFRKYWAESAVAPDVDTNVHFDYTYDHPEYGHLHYTVSFAPEITSQGELYFTYYVPADIKTLGVFAKIAEESADSLGVIPLVVFDNWPEKPISPKNTEKRLIIPH